MTLDDVLNFLGADTYLPHSYCLTNDSLILIGMVGSNLVIGFAYVVIGAALLMKRHVIANLSSAAISLYGTFIVLCAMSHFSDTLVLYLSVYRLDVAIRAATAAVSAVTAAFTVLALWGQEPVEE